MNWHLALPQQHTLVLLRSRNTLAAGCLPNHERQKQNTVYIETLQEVRNSELPVTEI